MSFDRIAPHYHWLEWLFGGSTLQQCRIAWLDEVRDCKTVLIIGEGDGRFLQEAARRMPDADLTCVDGSSVMLRLAEKRFPAAKFIQATLPEWTPSGKYDLIVTHFFLDCLESADLAVTMGKLSAATSPGAAWLIADFQVPEEPAWAKWRARLLVAAAYAFFRVSTGLQTRKIVCPRKFLETAGFVRLQRSEVERGLLYSELWRRK